MKIVVGALLAALLLTVPARTAEKPDFTGVWKMNAAKSSFGVAPPPDSIDRKISHAEPLIQIEEEQLSPLGVQKTTRKYTTDGSSMSFESQGAHVNSSAVWDGTALVVVSNVTEVGVQFTDRMTLSEDGATLTSAVRITSPQGNLDIKVVFDRQ